MTLFQIATSTVFNHKTYKLWVTCKEMYAMPCQICLKCNAYTDVHVQKADFTSPESMARHTHTLCGSERRHCEGVHSARRKQYGVVMSTGWSNVSLSHSLWKYWKAFAILYWCRQFLTTSSVIIIIKINKKGRLL